MIYIGIDPSFSNTGLVAIDDVNKTITIASYGSSIGGNTFSNLFFHSLDRVSHISDWVHSQSPDYILTETPPPSGSFSSGLYGLDILLCSRLISMCDNVYAVAPTYVGHLHGTRKYTKTQSVELAKKLIAEYQSMGFTFNKYGRLSNDCAEALLFATRLFVKYTNIRNRFVELIPNYVHCKEIKLEVENG